MHEATFSIPSTRSYAELTEGTGESVELWCKGHCDLLYVSPSIADEVLEYVREMSGVEEQVEMHGQHIVVTGGCLRNHHTEDIDSYLERHNCMLQPPLRYENGNKICRILATDPANLTSLYRDLVDDFTVTVETKREIEAMPDLDSNTWAFENEIDLTEKQQSILQLAYRRGYYDIPRETTASELADELNLGRRTVDEHLRRAEQKMLATFFENQFPNPDQ